MIMWSQFQILWLYKNKRTQGYNPYVRKESKVVNLACQQLCVESSYQRSAKLRKNPPYDADFPPGEFIMPFVQENQQRRTTPISTA